MNSVEEEVSIKVHCLVSCMCEIIKRCSSVDYRSFYFGVWDAAFDVMDSGELTYYQHDLSHDYYVKWFERLFGPKVLEWYDQDADKATNLATLHSLLDNCPEERHIIVQIDLSLMPERENKYHQSPFPHFIMLSKTENEGEWLMLDPDFRWEGTVSCDKVIDAFVGNTFGGGFYIDAIGIHAPSTEAFVSFYEHSFDKDRNALTYELMKMIPRLMGEPERLFNAVKQLPVIAIRKYAYEHGLKYLMEQTHLDEDQFDAWTDLVEDIVKGLNTVQYKTIKMTMTGNDQLLSSIMRELEEIHEIELRVKRELDRQFSLWHKLALQEELSS